MTVPALIRAWLLKRLANAPVAMVILQPNCTTRASRLLARCLPPDLILLGTAEECRAARASGLRAALVWSGVDEQRFRPPLPGEKRDLRRQWGVPPDDYVVVHVGHLRGSRNLHALAPLASEPGVTPLVVASRRHAPESEKLRRELTALGVRVLAGYVPQVEELYRLADCYVFPVLAGAVATPLSVVEARASGLPVVTRRFRSLDEEIGLALGVEVVDSDEELVARTLEHRSKTSSSGVLPDDFTWSGVAQRVLSLLEDLTGTGGRNASATIE
jgi:glycosyltransferase involved in cell wall biosynthesis